MISGANDLEECVLFLVVILGENAYPARITAELARRMSRTIPVAAVHSMLNRFEEEGVLVSMSSEGKLESRRKRVYAITEYGRKSKHVPVFTETLNEMLNLHVSPRVTRR